MDYLTNAITVIEQSKILNPYSLLRKQYVTVKNVENMNAVINEVRKKIRLRDTRGNFSLGVRLPNKDYEPKLTRKEQNRIAVRKWALNHPDERKQYNKKWKKNNPDLVKQYSKTWRLKHGKEYYQNNRERMIKAVKECKERKKREQEEGFTHVKSGSKSVKNIIKYGDVIIGTKSVD